MDPMAERTSVLRAVLHAHGAEHDVVVSDAPGAIVYQDDLQIGVVPRGRGEVTPLPEGLVPGPTSAGSKRRFLQEREE